MNLQIVVSLSEFQGKPLIKGEIRIHDFLCIQTMSVKSSRCCSTREYVAVHYVLREAYKICTSKCDTLGTACVQRSAEDTLIGSELVQKTH